MTSRLTAHRHEVIGWHIKDPKCLRNATSYLSDSECDVPRPFNAFADLRSRLTEITFGVEARGKRRRTTATRASPTMIATAIFCQKSDI